jgi:hypothetical protein
MNELQKATLAEITGSVPGYLSKFSHIKGDFQARIVDLTDELQTDVRLKLKGCLRVSDLKKEGFFVAAAEIMRGATPTESGDCWDHNFFYVEKRHSYPVCRVALHELVSLLREHKRETTFLTPVFIASVQEDSNRWVQAFRAELIVISAVNKYGFTLINGEDHSNVEARPFNKITDLGLGDLKNGAYHFIPPAGFEFLDSLICVIPSNQRTVIKMFVQQTTFQTVADHKHTRKFFEDAYQKWEEPICRSKKRKFEWHLVWVLSKEELKINQHKKLNGKKQHGQKVKKTSHSSGYTEWFFSFSDVFSALDF